MANGTVYLSPIDKKSPVTREYVENHFVVQFPTMPAASLEYKDKIVQYTGATTSDYTNGCFYKCEEDSTVTPHTYAWAEINTQDVIDNLTSTATDQPLSANQGRVLNGIIGELSDLTTTVKSSIVNAINELVAKFAEYLPLSGGTITGTIIAGVNNVIKRNSDNDNVIISGGNTDGANLTLHGKSSDDGSFILQASNGSAVGSLKGTKDNLTWKASPVVTEHSGDTRYLNLAGGMMSGAIEFNGTDKTLFNNDDELQWGGKNIITESGGTMTGDIAFVSGRDNCIKCTDDNSRLIFTGGTDVNTSSYLLLNGKGTSSGSAELCARSGTASKALTLTSNGQLTFDGKHVFRGNMSGLGSATFNIGSGTFNYYITGPIVTVIVSEYKSGATGDQQVMPKWRIPAEARPPYDIYFALNGRSLAGVIGHLGPDGFFNMYGLSNGSIAIYGSVTFAKI